jgi:ATP-dependent protease Clp ATPase subunit
VIHETPRIHTIGAMTMGIFDRHKSACCAFCRKSKEKVGPLVEASVGRVYICYECARLCVHIVEEESKRRGLPLPEKKPLMTREEVDQFIQEQLKRIGQDSPEFRQ